MKRASDQNCRRYGFLSPRSGYARAALALLLAIVCPWPAWTQELALPSTSENASSSNGIAPQALPESAPPSPQSENLDEALLRRGDLNLHGLSLNAALFAIAEQWNINIVAGDLQGTVNGVFKQAPLREILDSILLSNGYNYRVVGKSLVVSKAEELGRINPFFQSATIPVRSADIDEVVEGARLLTTPQGQVRPFKSARSIVVLDFPDRVEMIRQFVTAIDGASGGGLAMSGSRENQPLEVAHFRTQYISARSAELALYAVISGDGRVAVIEKEDRLIVTDHPENLSLVEKLLVRIDQPRPQVRITALIYDISLQDIEQLGLKWNKLGYRSGDTSSAALATSTSPFDTLELTDGALTSLAGGAGNIVFGTLSRHIDINAVVLALQQARDARLLADPNVAVLDNEQAVFRSVREIPFQQLTETQQGGNIGTTAFRDAGITLTVTPKIASDGTISMEVEPEFSRYVGNDDRGQPIIDTRQAKTILRVANRQTVVIGGLRQRDDVGEYSGIPYLKDIKFVGRFFRSRTTSVRESELVVFIMPEIIDYADMPSFRQQLADDTVKCRLDHIPQAEGCSSWCRRLPPEYTLPPGTDGKPTDEVLPFPEESDTIPPFSAAQTPIPETKTTSAAHVHDSLANGRLRRLPAVGPLSPADEGKRTATSLNASPLRR
jgi:general secretion pathway protein D